MADMEVSLWRILILVCILAACAQQRTPTGGPRDTEAPRIVSAEPLPMSTYFDAQSIEIVFDEFVRLENVREQVLISPPLEDNPDIQLKGGRRLIIDLGDQELAENTTYTINLGSAVVDNNEGNVLESNVYLFSTGAVIDSLEMRGRILTAAYNRPCGDCLALIYPDVADSMILGGRPLYVARTDGEGNFYLSNLAMGDYQLMGLRDINGDLGIGETEPIAFTDSTLRPLERDTIGYTLRLSRAFQDDPALNSADWGLDGSYLELTFRGTDSIPEFAGSAHDRLSFIQSFTQQGDSLRLWFAPPVIAEDELIISYAQLQDTLSPGRVTERAEQSVLMVATLDDEQSPAELQFSSPIARLDTNGIELTRDSISEPFQIQAEFPALAISLSADWSIGNYTLTLDPGTVEDIYGASNDTLVTVLRLPSPESFGILRLDIDLPYNGDFVCQLLDKNDQVIRSVSFDDDGTWEVEYLNPDSYTLRVYEDTNGDDSWTPASFVDRRQPEPVFMLSEAIVIRANWEVEQEVKVDFRP
ncbi:MAG: Ig-like domain-containing protein [Flavobacteriales bacterium]|nr:Ig-like domain-containing protein [Flavobacteriales bacterium]